MLSSNILYLVIEGILHLPLSRERMYGAHTLFPKFERIRADFSVPFSQTISTSKLPRALSPFTFCPKARQQEELATNAVLLNDSAKHLGNPCCSTEITVNLEGRMGIKKLGYVPP